MIDSPLEVTPLDDRILAIALYCFYIFRDKMPTINWSFFK